MTQLHYFGTDLTSAGHYLWEVDRFGLHRARIGFNDIPFNPEMLPYDEAFERMGVQLRLGKARRYSFCGFTILAISGSCHDDRPGSKSIFFVRDMLSAKEMKELVLSCEVVVKMFAQMPFKIDWDEYFMVIT